MFRRGPPRPAPRGAGGLVALFLVVVGLLAATRSWWTPSAPDGVLIEVGGDVPHPGVYALDAPTAGAGLRAAGLDPSTIRRPLPPDPLEEGDRLWVVDGAVEVRPMAQPLLVALPIDLNEADAASLGAIPGIGARTAAAVVADRAARGAFRSVDDLSRVGGVGAGTVEQLRPFVTVVEPPRVDVNTASAEELETLPGIGPVLAARIVVERADGGPFATVADLQRVSGIGPATVAALTDHVAVSP